MRRLTLATVRAAALAAVLVLAPLQAGVSAAEIDSVTPRGIALADSLQAINAIFRQRLREGVARANARQDDFAAMDSSEFCDRDRLYTEVRQAVFGSFLPRWGLRGYDLDRQMRELLAGQSHGLPLDDSIYRDLDYLEGPSLRLKALSDVVLIDGHLIGLDKIGHFFAEGWAYFERTHAQGESLEQAMQWGSRQEAGKFGYATTGIYSYADLVANLHGWRFWNRLVRAQDDPLRGLIANRLGSPYVRCELQILASIRHGKLVRAWKLRKSFDLAEYVDGAWDEANNCNSYADPVIEAKVDARIEQVAPGFRCPLDPAQCRRASERYGGLASFLLHPSCLNAGEP